jgi:hypothetical protein
MLKEGKMDRPTMMKRGQMIMDEGENMIEKSKMTKEKGGMTK